MPKPLSSVELSRDGDVWPYLCDPETNVEAPKTTNIKPIGVFSLLYGLVKSTTLHLLLYINLFDPDQLFICLHWLTWFDVYRSMVLQVDLFFGDIEP